MKHNLAEEKVGHLLFTLSIPAILGMLSSAIFNIADRIFVGKISSSALTAVGITMPVQILQMAFILLIGIGTSSLISIKLGEGKKEEAEDILYLAFKYILIFLTVFAVLFFLFLDPILSLLAISDEVLPFAKEYICIIIAGSIIGIPGYCLNNSLRSIGQAAISMKIIVLTSLLNLVLDPLFIFGFDWGIAGAALATVISQTTLTIYVVAVFVKRADFMIHLKKRRVSSEMSLMKQSIKMGMPSFYVQILATAVNLFVNYQLLRYGNDLDIAAITIMSSIFSFYHMVIFGLVQGNNAVCGYNWGAKNYDRVRQSLMISLFWAFLLSSLLFMVVMVAPHSIVDLFTDKKELADLTASGIRLYLSMLPLVGLQTISSQYFQAVGKAKRSSVLSFLRYGVVVIPAVLILAPFAGINGIFFANALSDGIASVVAIVCIVFELHKLHGMEAKKVHKVEESR